MPPYSETEPLTPARLTHKIADFAGRLEQVSDYMQRLGVVSMPFPRGDAYKLVEDRFETFVSAAEALVRTVDAWKKSGLDLDRAIERALSDVRPEGWKPGKKDQSVTPRKKGADKKRRRASSTG